MLVHGVELIEDGDMVIRHQNQTGVPFEGESVAAWIDACKPGGVAIDVGAYTGLYSILAAQNGAQSHAFEPNPAVFYRLSENVRANRATVNCYCCAASDFNGQVEFVGRPSVALTSGGKVKEGSGTECATIDSMAFEGVTAIKIDAEGHELEVLRGAVETIKRDKPLIITEALSVAANQTQDCFLSPLGYTSRKADQWNLIWEA